MPNHSSMCRLSVNNRRGHSTRVPIGYLETRINSVLLLNGALLSHVLFNSAILINTVVINGALFISILQLIQHFHITNTATISITGRVHHKHSHVVAASSCHGGVYKCLRCHTRICMLSGFIHHLLVAHKVPQPIRCHHENLVVLLDVDFCDVGVGPHTLLQVLVPNRTGNSKHAFDSPAAHMEDSATMTLNA